jgi:hypothetical protein
MRAVGHSWLAALLALGSAALLAQEAVAPLRRNPFSRPDYVVALTAAPVAEGGATSPVALELRATLVANGIRLANIDGEILAVGESYAGYRLVRIEEGRVTVRKDGERLVLDAYARQTGADTRSP